MKKIVTSSLFLLLTYMNVTFASIVNVISYDGAFAGNSSTDYLSLSLLDNTAIANNLSDSDMATYLFGSSLNNTVTSANLQLQFQDTVYNGDGLDLAFYFVSGSTETNNMQICFSTDCTPTTTYTATPLSSVGVDIGGTIYQISVVAFDLSDFGFSANDTLGIFNIDLVAGGYNRLASINALNTLTTPVPVPSALLLLLSGFSIFGFWRRKQ